MPSWSEDFSGFSLEQILKLQAENRVWSKQLRLDNATLVNNRLAKRIDQEQYHANRSQAHQEVAECKRRAAILDNEINVRAVR